MLKLKRMIENFVSYNTVLLVPNIVTNRHPIENKLKNVYGISWINFIVKKSGVEYYYTIRIVCCSQCNKNSKSTRR